MEALDLFSDFISLFYPNYCYGCKGALVKGEDTLCTRCLFDLPKTNYHKNSSNPLKERLAGRLNLDHALAFLKFRKEGIVQHLLHELKYNNRPEVGIRLGRQYGYELKQNNIDNFDLIVPVPLHESRKRKRGYNQSSKFAEGLSQSLGVLWDEHISLRKTSTATQTRKTKAERWNNVKDVFDVRGTTSIKNKHILLVDDVITTGATIEACGSHLLEQGCTLSIACIAEA
jgi:ComF family protein